MSPIEIYKYILKGDVKEFPKGFWLKPEAIDNAKTCAIYMIEEILKYNLEDVKKKVNANTFRENRLGGMLKNTFNNKPFEIIKLIYPNIKEWELSNTSKKFWDNDDNKIDAIKWLIEEKLKLSDDEIKEKLSVKLFHENGLRKCLRTIGGSPFKAIDLAYPKRFREDEFNVLSSKKKRFDKC